ncbi:MAG: hypothetical protein HY903_15940 [Deltaproteobacteria bacterium]|nr:hypothetical protein [Deltaproteobacteria bacterium]
MGCRRDRARVFSIRLATAAALIVAQSFGCSDRHPGAAFTKPLPPPLLQACSFSTPQGVCPAADGEIVVCVDGVCREQASLVPCDAAHPQGWCPADELCVAGACKTALPEELCSAANPAGACGYGALCFDGVCYPVADAELCAPTNLTGVCPTGQSCDAGACVTISASERCSPERPDGRCDAFEACVAGQCTPATPPDLCAPERPSGRCPATEACIDGRCTPVDDDNACSASNLAGLCPQDGLCVDGYCVPRVGPGSPCSPENPEGVCPDASPCSGNCTDLCVQGTCRPADAVARCSLLHPAGYCPPGELCVDAGCAPASAANACGPTNPGGACVAASLCLDGVCYPLRDAELCNPNNPAGVCGAGEYCNGGLCTPVTPGEGCSALNPDGFCDAFERCVAGSCTAPELPDACSVSLPAGRCPTGAVCVAGVCTPLDSGVACTLDNRAGVCPRDYQCVAGYCVAAVGQDAPCAPNNPYGRCPAGQGCADGGCRQITPDNVCSEWMADGLCPSGMVCHVYFPTGCQIAPGVEPCGVAHPEGPCADGGVCVDGVCALRPCSTAIPDGTCPNGLMCAAGECLFPTCGPLVPYSGVCPPGYVCADGVCRSLSGAQCAASHPDGACVDAAFVCDDRSGAPTFGTCVPRCSPGAEDGYCGGGRACQAGFCLGPCASGVVCRFSGQCCPVGDECPDAETCVPACPAPRVRCNNNQLCCDQGLECRSDGICVPRCDSGIRCGVSGELCCTGTEVCSEALECRRACAAPARPCADLCCAAGETCLHDQCVAEGGSCRDFLDCDYNQYCEPTLGRCLPADVAGDQVCQYPRPAEIFNPALEWRFTGLWPDCRPSFDCRGGECALSCDADTDCEGACVDQRCTCQNNADCVAGSQRCRDGVCVLAGSSCGALFENVLSIPTVADLQRDGVPEVVFRAYAAADLAHSALVVLNGKDGGDGTGTGSPPALWVDGDSPGAPWLFAAGHQAIGNLDADPELEIVAVAATGLVAFDDPVHGPGAVLWRTTAYPLDRTLDGGAPAIVDLNGDGAAEVIMGAAVLNGQTGLIVAVPAGAAAREGGGSRFDGGWISIAADVDLDGKPELITGNRAYNVEESGGSWSMTPLWQSVTGVLRPPAYTTAVNVPSGFTAVGNFIATASGVDTPEVVNVAGGNLYLFDGASGALVAGPIPVPAGAAGVNHGGPPTVADFDGDGRPEVAAAGSGCYAVYDFDCLAGYDAGRRADVLTLPGCALPPVDRCGSYPSMVGVLWNYKVQDFSSAVTGSSVFDFDGNGADEVLYNDECFFRVFDGKTGGVLLERPSSSRTNSEYPIVVDVDGDRMSEIVLVSNHDQVSRDHCVANYDNDPAYAAYLHYSDLAGAGGYCDLTTFPDHSRECTVGAAGVTVYRDTSERWVKTRPLWPEHAYHVTDVDFDPATFTASVPAAETPSWLDSNTYRKNVRGFVPLNAPDLQISAVVADLQGCPEVGVHARVVNLGALGVQAGIALNLYALWDTPPRVVAALTTAAALAPGAGEWVTFRYTPAAGDPAVLSFRVGVDLGAGGGAVAECLEANNTAEVDDVACQATVPVARCLVASPPVSDISPLATVIFDGSFSYSPRAPADPAAIVSYSWNVVGYPEGAWPGDFAPQGNGTARYSVWLPIAGTYTVQLLVSDSGGGVSAATEASRCTIVATPTSFVHVQLVWDDGVNDQDLHVVWWSAPGGNRRLFEDHDCYYANPLPAWYGSFAENPRLDIDDTFGHGPESFNIDRPAPGTYRVYVNYAGNHFAYFDTPRTTETVRIYLGGQLAGEYRRELGYGGDSDAVSDIWAVADIVWEGDGSHFVTPLQSDVPSDPQIVGYLCSVTWDGGWWGSTCPTAP